MTPTTAEHTPANERSSNDRKEPTYLFTEKYVSEESETARKFLDSRERLKANVDKANNFLVKRFYNIDHNTYLEGTLPAKTKELMDWSLPPVCDAMTVSSTTRSRPTAWA